MNKIQTYPVNDMRDTLPPSEVLSSRQQQQDSLLLLGLLSAVDGDAQQTQRSIANELDVALGLVNSYLKRCLKKGLIKVTQAPARRYCYYLTPSGMAEKARLTAEFLSQSFKLLKQSRIQCMAIYDRCADHGWLRLGLVGNGDLAEVAVLVSHASKIKVVAVLDEAGGEADAGVPIYRSVTDLPEIDAILITNLYDPQGGYQLARQHFADHRIFTLPVLHVVRSPQDGDGPDDAA